MKSLLVKIRTALALGLPSIARVTAYRLGVKLRFNPACRLRVATPQGPFFQSKPLQRATPSPVANWHTSAQLFGRWPIAVNRQPPDWWANPLTGRTMANPDRDWWNIPDFDPSTGDIKVVWELSRMDWVLAFAQRAHNADAQALSQLNAWLADWCENNPPYRGPNWKCGQEASLRVMHLAMAALLLDQTSGSSSGLLALVDVHLQRIAPTIHYAVGQDNNHGTSEAAALFVGGSWLAVHGSAQGRQWQDMGRKWLENRAARLIGQDGGFSQYSLNYHRLLLDTLSMAELWRRHVVAPEFSNAFYQRAAAATGWLYQMISPDTGDGPNVGANDGARLLQLSNTTYRDYRPSVQLAMTLFNKQQAYPKEGAWNEALQWLGIELPQAHAPSPGSFVDDGCGFAVLRHGPAMAMLRYPRFRFRPSQADALHLDLWLRGSNLLCDDGSYSYHAAPECLQYFGSTASHNTVQFDDRDQMPRLGRFLLGDWLGTSFVQPLTQRESGVEFAAGYRDRAGGSHRRQVMLGNAGLRVVDDVSGFKKKAVLRWRLPHRHWRLEGQRWTDGTHTLTVKASVPIARCEVVDGWQSRHYLEKTPVSVLEVEIEQAGTLTTHYEWAA
ncbi:MAG: heparinase II/III-family protein [Rhodoferax sp.]|nr:heparinase II/III-family protein [Rhodoferax sp.]